MRSANNNNKKKKRLSSDVARQTWRCDGKRSVRAGKRQVRLAKRAPAHLAHLTQGLLFLLPGLLQVRNEIREERLHMRAGIALARGNVGNVSHAETKMNCEACQSPWLLKFILVLFSFCFLQAMAFEARAQMAHARAEMAGNRAEAIHAARVAAAAPGVVYVQVSVGVSVSFLRGERI